MRSSSVIAGLFIVLIVSIVLLFANFAYLNTQSNHDKQYIGHAGELRVLSQRIAKNATEAAAGKGEAFKLLKDARNDFEKRWNILVNGDEYIPAAQPRSGEAADGRGAAGLGRPAQERRLHPRQRTDRTVPAPGGLDPRRNHPAAAGGIRRGGRHPAGERCPGRPGRGRPAPVAARRAYPRLGEQGAGRRRELGAGRRQLRPRRQPVRPRTEGHAGRQRGDEHLQGDQRRGGGSPERDRRTLRVRLRLGGRDPRDLARPVPGPGSGEQHLQRFADPAGQGLATGRRLREPGRRA